MPATISSTPISPRGDWKRGLMSAVAILAVAWIARIIFIHLLPFDAHSADVDGWMTVVGELAAGRNPYNTTTYLNWPPLWMQVLYGVAIVGRRLNISFVSALQLFLISVESIVIVLAWKTMLDAAAASGTVRSKYSAARVTILALSLNPIAILLNCQHMNFDVIVGLCALVCVNMLIRFQRDHDPVHWLIACAAIGVGMLTKTIPVVLVPLLLIGGRRLTYEARVLGAALVAGPVSLGMSIIYLLGPAQVTANVLRYRSVSGYFGFSGVLAIAGRADWIAGYSVGFISVFLIGLFFLAIVLRRLDRVPPHALILLAALLLMAAPALGPGYANQYIYWFLPLLAVATTRRPGRARRVIIGWMIVAVATNIFQYAFTESLGAFLPTAFPGDPSFAALSFQSAGPSGETIVRLPLFAAYLALLWYGSAAVGRELIDEFAGERTINRE